MVARVIPLRDDNPTRRTAMLTLLLIAANVGIYFLVQPAEADVGENVRFNYEMAAIPCELTTGEPLSADEISAAVQGVDDARCSRDGDPYFGGKSVWLAVLYSMFFHGGLLHLGGNMLYLWIFGNNIEDHLGHLRFVLFYVVAGIAATAAHVALQPDSTIPLVGASGAIAGIMGAYLVWFPNARILTAIFVLLIFVRHIAAKWLLGFWFVSQFFISPNECVAWAAHVGGFVFGVVVGLLVRGTRAARRVAVRSTYVDDWR
jgi:membrane associated rhomboid family serine protease